MRTASTVCSAYAVPVQCVCVYIACAVRVQRGRSIFTTLTTHNALTALTTLTSLLDEPILERRHRRGSRRKALGRAACAACATRAAYAAAACAAARFAAHGLIDPLQQSLEHIVAMTTQAERGSYRRQRRRQAARPLVACMVECGACRWPEAHLLARVEAEIIELQPHLGVITR